MIDPKSVSISQVPPLVVFWFSQYVISISSRSIDLLPNCIDGGGGTIGGVDGGTGGGGGGAGRTTKLKVIKLSGGYGGVVGNGGGSVAYDGGDGDAGGAGGSDDGGGGDGSGGDGVGGGGGGFSGGYGFMGGGEGAVAFAIKGVGLGMSEVSHKYSELHKRGIKIVTAVIPAPYAIKVFCTEIADELADGLCAVWLSRFLILTASSAILTKYDGSLLASK